LHSGKNPNVVLLPLTVLVGQLFSYDTWVGNLWYSGLPR